METKLTKKIKAELIRQRPFRGYYAVPEVTIKSNYLKLTNGKHLYDRADVVEWDDTEHFTCYEIKVSEADAKSDNIISMFGDRNYLVAPTELAIKIANHPNDFDLDWRLGVLAYNEDKNSFKVLRKCSIQKSIKLGDKIQVLEAFARAGARETKKLYKWKEKASVMLAFFS